MMTLDALTDQMLAELRMETGAKGPGLVLWGETPKDLELALYDMLSNLEEPIRGWVRKVLPDLVETSAREGYTVLVLVPTEEGVYAKGASVQLEYLPLEGHLEG
ncbi:hypothetical protein TJA_07640 [Thermus sp. LT1-2-5]|uniref:hypothetical protein n=1 Tax=Thermus sp. LT1-2-5 TaxID=3026935 RepID=UPI0030E9509D